jgi:NAD(P)-dependent dehydrogenase (short-subunit alcohol dehydrogenase family)
MSVKRGGTVIVTGAGGEGCGRAIARRFSAAGASVVIADIDVEGGEKTVRFITEAGGRALFRRTDVRNADDMRALVPAGEAAFGPLAVFVNNASGPRFRPDAPLEDWIETAETELLGTMHGTRFAVDALRRAGGGAIVNMASISALAHGRESRGSPAYDAANAGVIRLTTSLAWLAGTDGIRVNCLAPGWIATEGPRQYWQSLSPDQRKERSVPSKLLEIDSVADMVVHIAEDENLAGRVLAWSSEDAEPHLVEWADRGYARWATYVTRPSGAVTAPVAR